MAVLVISVIFYTFIHLGEMHKILLLPGNIGSHLIFFGRLAEELISNGNQVTMVTGSRTIIPQEVDSLSKVTFESFYQQNEPFTELQSYKQPLIHSAFTESTLDVLVAMGNLFKHHTVDGLSLLEDQHAMGRLLNGSYDFVVVDYVIPSYYIVPHKMKVPYAVLGLSPPTLARRMPYLPTYVPTATSFYGDNMTFKERLLNLLHNLYLAYIQRSEVGQALVAKHVPDREPKGLSEIVADASLFITIRDLLFETPRPSSPDVIPMGNLMGRPANHIPKDLNDFMSSSKNGVIVVSFGSWLDDLPKRTILNMIEAFKHVKQHVLWKYNGQIAGSYVPKNVRIVKWFEQNDILGHPKVKLFIAHGGLNSLIEAVYHSVPMVLLPIGIDQYTNSVLAADRGYAVILPIGRFTPKELSSSIDNVLTNPSYKLNIAKAAIMMKEMKASKVTNPAFWIDHVIRHGVSHLRSRAFDLPWYQLYMVDILLVLLIVVSTVIYVVYLLFCHSFKCVTSVSKGVSCTEFTKYKNKSQYVASVCKYYLFITVSELYTYKLHFAKERIVTRNTQ